MLIKGRGREEKVEKPSKDSRLGGGQHLINISKVRVAFCRFTLLFMYPYYLCYVLLIMTFFFFLNGRPHKNIFSLLFFKLRYN